MEVQIQILTSSSFTRFTVNRCNILVVFRKPFLNIIAERLDELDAWWVVIVEGKRSTLLRGKHEKGIWVFNFHFTIQTFCENRKSFNANMSRESYSYFFFFSFDEDWWVSQAQKGDSHIAVFSHATMLWDSLQCCWLKFQSPFDHSHSHAKYLLYVKKNVKCKL